MQYSYQKEALLQRGAFSSEEVFLFMSILRKCSILSK
jgi:hypothetical protein